MHVFSACILIYVQAYMHTQAGIHTEGAYFCCSINKFVPKYSMTRLLSVWDMGY